MTQHRFTLNRIEMLDIDFTQEACDVFDDVQDTLLDKYSRMDYPEVLDFDQEIDIAAERITLGNLS